MPWGFAKLRRRLEKAVYELYKRHEYQLERSDQRKLVEELALCGKYTKIYPPFKISSRSNVKIGANVHIGRNCWIRGDGGLTIGDNTHISRNLVLYTVNHDYKGDRIPYDETLVERPVRIGRCVWIGMNVCVAPGTIIGDGAIIGMGTTVSGEVPAFAIVGSAKWRVLKYRDRDHYQQLDANGAYGGINGAPIVRKRDAKV